MTFEAQWILSKKQQLLSEITKATYVAAGQTVNATITRSEVESDGRVSICFDIENSGTASFDVTKVSFYTSGDVLVCTEVVSIRNVRPDEVVQYVLFIDLFDGVKSADFTGEYDRRG